jgi:hypothetical protein
MLTKIVLRGLRIPLIEAKMLFPFDKVEFLFRCGEHDRAFAPTQRTVTTAWITDWTVDFELDPPAMTGAFRYIHNCLLPAGHFHKRIVSGSPYV